MRSATKLRYLTSAFFGKRAGTIQIARMCDAFAENGAAVELLAIVSRHHNCDTVKAFYGLKNDFAVRSLAGVPMLRNYDFVFRTALSRFLRSIAGSELERSTILYGRSSAILPMSMVLKMRQRYGRGSFAGVFCEIHERLPKKAVEALHQADGVIVITEALKVYLLKEGFESERILVAPDAVDLAAYLPLVGLPKDELRHRVGLPAEWKVVIFTGHLYADRGIEVLIEAMKRLDESIVLVLVGGLPSDIQRVQSIVARAALEDRVKCLGHKPAAQIPAYQVCADVLVIPYSRKWRIQQWSSPLKMFEYMASKSPIVSTDFASLREILRHRRNCVLVPPDDPVALAAAVERLLKDRVMARALSEEAFNDVQKHTWIKRAARVLDFMQDVSLTRS